MFTKKRYLLFVIFLLSFFKFYSVHATEKTADEYVSLLKQYSYYQPYQALDLAIEANKAYPDDNRFTEEILSRSNTILSWSVGSQNVEHYSEAIYGYTKIKDISFLPSYMKLFIERQMSQAQSSKPIVTLQSYYSMLTNSTNFNPYKDLMILNEASLAYNSTQLTQYTNDRASTILSWSIGSQSIEHYDAAAYGYNAILNSPGVNDAIKKEAQLRLNFAKVNKNYFTADDQFNYGKSFSSYEPYAALKAFTDGYLAYPNDIRFSDNINASCSTILSWSIGSENKGNFETALYGLNKVLSSPALKDSIKAEAELRLNLVKNNQKFIDADENFRYAQSFSQDDPYNALKVLKEGALSYPSDSRFTNAINSRCSTILSWSLGSHSRGNYSAAIYGYDTILNAPGVNTYILNAATRYKDFASKSQNYYFTPKDYYSAIDALDDNHADDALDLVTLSLTLYPNDVYLNTKNKSISQTVLDQSKNKHQASNYDSAMVGYNLILSSLAPGYIKNTANVFKLLASEKENIIDKYVYNPNFEAIANNAKQNYINQKHDLIKNMDYKPFGSYLNFEKTANFTPSATLIFDKDGIPMVKYNDVFYYNPVTVCQYALTQYGKYLNGEDTKDLFIRCANFLINYAKEDGSFRYEFEYEHYNYFNKGWTSSMAQGQALSVFSRAFNLTKDQKYIQAGNKVLGYLLTPVANGGVLDTLKELDPSLSDNIFFQEYVNTPGSYTLNGYIFTLLGLYDWSLLTTDNVQYSDTAKQFFDKGITSLKKILPYYDIGGFTTYDLYFINKNSLPTIADSYHGVHIFQLSALYSITNDKFFKDVSDLWCSYVE